MFVWLLCEYVNVLETKLRGKKEKYITFTQCHLLYTEGILLLTTDGKYPL